MRMQHIFKVVTMAIHTFLLLIALPSLAGAVCNDLSNVCQLDNSTFTSANGYDCFQVHNQQQFMCTCYGNRFTMNEPCRCTTAKICGSQFNALACLDKSNSEYVCVCKNEDSYDIVENKPCGSATAVTTVAPTISTSTHEPDIAHFCINDGVHDPATQLCHCPSGFSGRSCDRFDLERVCDRIVCKNGGKCIYGHRNGNYYSECVCPMRFEGEYCEEEWTLGTCQYEPYDNRSCSGYLCRERVESDGQTYFKCGACPVTSVGARCNRDSDTSGCKREGDTCIDPYMHEQGKYFLLGESHRGSRPIYRNSCPKGLRYNITKKLCVLPEYA
jgi:hypothetical protein